ncbi:Mov34/MPN/PAD-1 family protein [Pelagerythrobacter sp.]|uniref:Mov34/MPN/PAD-1 family protein n=1 Tax=Pelagerythrobacter sp. TaxID=2800702 RepID=UPI0035B17843
MDIEVTRAAVDQIMAEAERAHPRECCGILLGEGARVTAARPAPNVHPSVETHFEIDPQALIDAHRAARAGKAQVLGYYHSHPNGRAAPSSTDQAWAAHDGRVWAIAAQGEVTFWRDDEAGFVPLSLRAIDR